jgi:hypothetical protein
MGDTISSEHLHRQVFIAAAQDEPLATELVTALRECGLDAIKIESVQQATQADEALACIVVLRPGIWRSEPFIANAMRAYPRYMIPVLIESMPLPPSSWAAEPVNVQDPLSVTAQELTTLIHKHVEQESANAKKSNTKSFSLPVPGFQRPSRRRLGPPDWPRRILTVVLVLVICASIFYLVPLMKSRASHVMSDGGSGIATPADFFTHPYTTAVPGPGCDSSGANWQVGTRYKAIPTPEPSTSQGQGTVQETPTPQTMIDTSVMTTCQKNGLLVSRSPQSDSFATIILPSNGEALPTHYRFNVTATLLSGGIGSSFFLGMHIQSGKSDDESDDSGYGGYAFIAYNYGYWESVRYNDATGQIDHHFTDGLLDPTHSFVLSAEVDGPRMTFYINNKKMTTSVDNTYPDSYGIDFGVVDSSENETLKALFSNFSYTPLP